MPNAFPFAVPLAALFVAAPSLAATRAMAPAGGGLASLDVRVDLNRAVVQWGSAETPIGLARPELPGEEGVTVEVLAIGSGRHVAHVRVAARGAEESGPAWEALFAAGRTAPIFAGRTGLGAGDPGERTGTAVAIVPNGLSSYVLVGALREDLRICGQTSTLLEPRALYPASLDLRPATVQQLSAQERARAESVTVTDKGTALETPLAKLLTAHGSSVADSRGGELTDGDLSTTWREQRPGVGQGEFVVMAAPKDVPMARVQIVLGPSSPDGAGATAAPKTFYLVASAAIFAVTLPDDAAQKPGEVYEVAFPHPVEASCLSLVLGDAYGRGMARPDVGLAEIVGYSEFDAPGVTLDDIASRLSGPRGDAAAQVLERSAGALSAVSRAYSQLDARGRARAMDIAASSDRCEDAAPLLATGSCDPAGGPAGGEAARKAREKLERCPGAGPALAKRLREDRPSRACVAPVLAALAPAQALQPIADAMGETPESDAMTRASLRAAFGEALGSAPGGVLSSLSGDPRRSPSARLEILRAADARVTEARAAGDATIADVLKGAPTARTRYLVLGPLGFLARAGDAAALNQIVFAIGHDPEGPVRARAAEMAAGLAGADGILIAATHDPEPRVRAAALSSLVTTPSDEAVRAASEALARDEWTFVKTQAIAVLVSAPGWRDVSGPLGSALRDAAPRVRGAALVALAQRHVTALRGAIRQRLDDEGEDAEVRAAAASALGSVCDLASVGRLTELTRPLRGVAADEDAREIGLGALVGLAAIHPLDLKERLAPLLAPSAPPAVREAAVRALAARGLCP